MPQTAVVREAEDAAEVEVHAPTPTTSEVEAFLVSLLGDLDLDTAPAGKPGPGRPRILPALLLWGGLVVCVLEGATSQRALWRRLADRGLWGHRGLAITDQAVYARLANGGVGPLSRLFTLVTSVLAERVGSLGDRTLAPFASGVYAIDETTLERLPRQLPVMGDRGRALPVLAGKLGARLNVRTQQWERIIRIDDPAQNEKVAARGLVDDLPRGSLVLFDLGYFAFRWFDDLAADGLHWISRMRAGTSTTEICVLYTDEAQGIRDRIVWLGGHRADRARHAVRLVEFEEGGQPRRYLTSVLDPEQLSIAEIARLYARRWDIEQAIRLVKRELGIHLWWSSQPDIIEQQLWAALIIHQIVQALRLEIAHRAEVDVFEVSVALLVEQLPRYLAAGWDPIERFVTVGPRMGYIRPSRRVTIRAPIIPLSDYAPLPGELVLTRTPRYAERKSLHRPAPGQ